MYIAGAHGNTLTALWWIYGALYYDCAVARNPKKDLFSRSSRGLGTGRKFHFKLGWGFMAANDNIGCVTSMGGL